MCPPDEQTESQPAPETIAQPGAQPPSEAAPQDVLAAAAQPPAHHAVIDAWFSDLLGNIPELRATEPYNKVRAAIDDLKTRL
jgi:hypothetical protein